MISSIGTPINSLGRGWRATAMGELLFMTNLVRAILSEFALACQRMNACPYSASVPSRRRSRHWPVVKGQQQKSIPGRWDAPSEGQNAVRYAVDSAKRSKEESNKQ